MPEPALQQRDRIICAFCGAHALTPREKQIFSLICSGAKNTSSAVALDVSEATIRLHMTSDDVVHGFAIGKSD